MLAHAQNTQYICLLEANSVKQFSTGQSYEGTMIVNYNSRVIIYAIILDSTDSRDIIYNLSVP